MWPLHIPISIWKQKSMEDISNQWSIRRTRHLTPQEPSTFLFPTLTPEGCNIHLFVTVASSTMIIKVQENVSPLGFLWVEWSKEVEFAKTKKNKNCKVTVNSCSPIPFLPTCAINSDLLLMAIFFHIFTSFLKVSSFAPPLLWSLLWLKIWTCLWRWTWHLACRHDFLSGIFYLFPQLLCPLVFPSHSNSTVHLLAPSAIQLNSTGKN